MEMSFYILIFFLHLSITPISAYRILMTSPQIPSHVLEQVALGSVLLEAGHEVHLVLESGFSKKLVKTFEKKGFRVVQFKKPSDVVSFSSQEYQKDLGRRIFDGSVSLLGQISRVGAKVNEDCTFMMNDEEFLLELQSYSYDMAVVEPFIPCMCPLILPKFLNISFVSLVNTFFALDIRSPGLPSIYPRHFTELDTNEEMSFLARFTQFLMIFGVSSNIVVPFDKNFTLLRRFATHYSDWGELLRESLLFFFQSDHHFNAFFPTLPNHISVAGLTSHPAEPLPAAVEKFLNERILDGFDPGLILLSFGSSANHLPYLILMKFFSVFARLNETVIAKFMIKKNDRELISLIPPNVLVLNWLPQNDILGHPSTKLFITHCGNNGQHEALYHGIPMLGFPLFAEQANNCRRMASLGFGLRMNILDFSEDELFDNIKQILENSTYKVRIQDKSRAFRDQPMTAQQKALFWIEHVIKHGGGHLRSSSMNMPLYQFLCLDSVGLFLLLIALAVWAFYKIVKMVLVKMFKILTGFGKKREKLN